MTEEHTASVTELQRHAPALADRAENGQPTVITRHGKPIARLVPYGLPVDDLDTFEALMGDAEQAIAAARDFGRRHTTPTQEDQ